MNLNEVEIADWRRRVNELYAAVRSTAEPASAYAVWREGRDDLFKTHPQSPLPPDDALRTSGLSYWAYNPALRFELQIHLVTEPRQLKIPTDDGYVTTLRRLGRIELPTPIRETVDIWWLEQYGGGLFVPLRDGTAGTTSYGGGRYLLDSAKGADLGGGADSLVVDLNFLYHPSCRYSPEWQCPLAPETNVVAAAIEAGERLN